MGSEVTKFAVGDHVGIGCMVDSCMKCSDCLKGEAQRCAKQVATYQGKDLNGRAETYPKGLTGVFGPFKGFQRALKRCLRDFQ